MGNPHRGGIGTGGEMSTERTSTRSERTERLLFIARGLLRALAITIAIVAVYFVLPLEWIDGVPLVVVLIVAPLVLVGVTAWHIAAIVRSPLPGLQAIEALATVAPLYLLLFAGSYFLMGIDDPASFSAGALSRIDALYFTTTVFATVGFGDISPASDAARVLATVQMVLNLLVLGAGIRLLTTAVQRGRRSQDADAAAQS